MKLFARTNGARLLLLVSVLAILIAFWRSLPDRPVVPAQADPETTYHVVWQAVGETFYDTQKLSEWQTWEHKYDGQLKTHEDAYRAIDEMLKSLDDRFTYFVRPQAAGEEAQARSGSFVGIGVILTPVAVKDGKVHVGPKHELMPASDADNYPLITDVIEGGPAAAAGIKAGDAVVSVTDVSSGKTVDARTLTLSGLSAAIKGQSGSEVKLVLRRSGQAVEVVVKRGPVQILSVTHKRLPGNIGYIRIAHFGADNMIPQLIRAVDALKDTRGLVIDLRNNPGGLVPNAINGAAVFLEKGKLVTTRNREAGRIVEVEYALTADRLVIAALSGQESDLATMPRPVGQRTRLPLVILVNEHSASASEMFAGALQDNGRAVVVGVKTVGKGIGQSVLPMPNGTLLHVTSLRYYTPDMHWVGDAAGGHFARGIIPDLTVQADKFAGDVQLRAAVKELESMAPAGK